MSWVKLDDQVTHHPKVLKAGPVAAWTWVCCIAYASQHLTDGFVPFEALTTFGVPQAAKHAAKLLEVGLLEAAEGGYRVHDYHAYNAPAETVKAKRQEVAARVGAWRQKRTSNATCNSVTHPLNIESVTHPVTRYTNECNARPVPVQYQVPPIAPLLGAVRSRPSQLRKRAEELRRKAWGRCPHDPPCDTYDACIAQIIEDLQTRQADLDHEATG